MDKVKLARNKVIIAHILTKKKELKA